VNAPVNCDIDYIGNTNDFHHLVTNKDLSKDELNFNMNLRTYGNTSNFGPEQPWKYPATKLFRPKEQLKDKHDSMKVKNEEFKQKFKDKLGEKNVNEILHMARKNDIYGTTQWMCQLRGDRDDKISKDKKEAIAKWAQRF